MRSHDADRADLRIAGRSSRVLSHSDVLRLASACAPSFAGCLGLKLLFFSGASWHNITLRQTLSARKALQNTSSLSLHLPIPTYISPPVPVSNLRLNSQASAQREPIDNHPSFLPRQRVNRPIRLLFSPGFDLEA